MAGWLTPARRRGVELLDDPATPDPVRVRAMADLARSNALFGGTRAVRAGLARAVDKLPDSVLVLDVATGTADIPARVEAIGRHRLSWVAVDRSAALLARAPQRVPACCADAFALPFRDGMVDVVVCSQFLHHFTGADAAHVVAELHRVAKHAVVVSDLDRSWIATAGFWLASLALRFHAITRHDGVVSVLRGFTRRELRKLIHDATGVQPSVTWHPGWRLVAVWHRTVTGPDHGYT